MGRRVSAALLLTVACGACQAQPPDSVLQDERNDTSVADCRADADCTRLLHAQRGGAERSQAAYESKSSFDKMLPWLLLAGGFFGAYRWVGRKKK